MVKGSKSKPLPRNVEAKGICNFFAVFLFLEATGKCHFA